MANWLHYHPDAVIYIRDGNDAPLYEATFDEFKADYGQPFPPLPGGAAQLELWKDGAEEGNTWRVSLYDQKHNELDAFDVDPAPYHTVLAALPRLVEAKVVRLEEAKKPKKPRRVKADRP